MMTRDEVIDVLSMAAAYDQRTASEGELRAWCATAEVANWTAAAAQRVVIEHYSRGADRPRITAAAISDRLREVERAASKSFLGVKDVPGETGAEYTVRLRRAMDEHKAKLLDPWVTHGVPIHEGVTAEAVHGAGDGPLALPAGKDSEARRQVVEMFPRIGRKVTDPRKIRPNGRLPLGDPARLEAARRELEERRQALAGRDLPESPPEDGDETEGQTA